MKFPFWGVFILKWNTLVEYSEPPPSSKHRCAVYLRSHLPYFFSQYFLQFLQPIVFPIRESFLVRAIFQILQHSQEVCEYRVNGVLHISLPHLYINMWYWILPDPTHLRCELFSRLLTCEFRPVQVSLDFIYISLTYGCFWWSFRLKILKVRSIVVCIWCTLAVYLFRHYDSFPQFPFPFFLLYWYIWVSYHGFDS